NLLYAVDQTTLRTIDVSDPISPTERASIGGVQDVQIAGDLAYLTGDAELRVYNIGNPDSPALVGQLPIASVATSDTLRVWVVGARAYVGRLYSVSCGRFCSEGHMDLTVVDVANPLNPQTRGRIDVYAPTQLPVLAIVGTTIYIPGRASLIDIYRRGILIDAADPNKPVLRDAQLMSDMHTFWADGARGYAATFSTLETLDLSNPLEPRLVGKLAFSYVLAASVVGDTAYLAADGLRVVDLSDPARPLPRATHAAFVQGLVADAPYVYLALGEDGLRIVRLNPDAFPRPVYLPLVARF
ncbi:MAG TPA: hypothetical protein VFS21_12460, partial [Roseiflexaceae bacterium]|nr:hypothetical protein [Roseiflexaceae bacterium]